MLFGPFPALDGKLGLLRKQEPWSRLGSNPLLQMEVRGLCLGDGWKKGPLVTHTFWGVCGVHREVEAGWRHLSASMALWNPGTEPTQWMGRVKSCAVLSRPLVISWLECRFYQSPVPCPQELLLAPALLEQLTCAPGSGELGRILTMPEGHQVDLQGYRDALCSGQATARAQRFNDLATELRNQLDMAKIAQQVRSRLLVGQQTC